MPVLSTSHPFAKTAKAPAQSVVEEMGRPAAHAGVASDQLSVAGLDFRASTTSLLMIASPTLPRAQLTL